jgi:hypothetical protein
MRISTVRGITIDFSEELENASDSIRFNLELNSIEIDERDSHQEKQREPRISTVRGITIDFSEESEIAPGSISLTGNNRPIHTMTRRREIRSSPLNPAANASRFNRRYCASSTRSTCPFDTVSLTSVLAESLSIAELEMSKRSLVQTIQYVKDEIPIGNRAS